MDQFFGARPEAIRKELLLLLVNNRAHQKEILKILTDTQYNRRKKIPIKLKLSDSELKIVKQKIESNDKKTFYEGFDRLVIPFGVNKSSLLKDEGLVFEPSAKLMKMLDKFLDKKDRINDGDGMIASYLYSYTPSFYKKRINLFLTGKNDEAVQKVLLYMKMNRGEIADNKEAILEIVNRTENNEIRNLAKQRLVELNDASILNQIVDESLNVSSIINAVLSFYNNGNIEDLIAQTNSDLGLFVVEWDGGEFGWSALYPQNRESTAGFSGSLDEAKIYLSSKNCLSPARVKSVTYIDDKTITSGSRYFLKSLNDVDKFWAVSYFCNPETVSNISHHFVLVFKINNIDHAIARDCSSNSLAVCCGIYKNKMYIVGLLGQKITIY